LASGSSTRTSAPAIGLPSASRMRPRSVVPGSISASGIFRSALASACSRCTQTWWSFVVTTTTW